MQGFKREWAPFVLTPDFVWVMGGEVQKQKCIILFHCLIGQLVSIQDSSTFETYKNLCCRAFLILRRHSDLIINLFSLVCLLLFVKKSCWLLTLSLSLSPSLAPSLHPSLSPFPQMRSTGIPELTCVEDTDYIRNALVLDKSEHEAEQMFRKVIKKCLDLKYTVQWMWRFHILRNLKKGSSWGYF